MYHILIVLLLRPVAMYASPAAMQWGVMWCDVLSTESCVLREDACVSLPSSWPGAVDADVTLIFPVHVDQRSYHPYYHYRAYVRAYTNKPKSISQSVKERGVWLHSMGWLGGWWHGWVIIIYIYLVATSKNRSFLEQDSKCNQIKPSHTIRGDEKSELCCTSKKVWNYRHHVLRPKPMHMEVLLSRLFMKFINYSTSIFMSWSSWTHGPVRSCSSMDSLFFGQIFFVNYTIYTSTKITYIMTAWQAVVRRLAKQPLGHNQYIVGFNDAPWIKTWPVFFLPSSFIQSLVTMFQNPKERTKSFVTDDGVCPSLVSCFICVIWLPVSLSTRIYTPKNMFYLFVSAYLSQFWWYALYIAHYLSIYPSQPYPCMAVWSIDVNHQWSKQDVRQRSEHGQC